MSDYLSFLKTKRHIVKDSGIVVSDNDIHPMLFPFQRDLTRWALRKGRAAIFADTGLGKTFMQLEFARLTGQRSLIVAPLSVARQTQREAEKLNLKVHYTRGGSDIYDGLNITNYEMIEAFNPDVFGCIVLDESSILKNIAGKTRAKLTAMFSEVQFRLCCTATPAPNDIVEIGNHAEFLGIMTATEMQSQFFVHDDKGWRLKRHAEEPFYRWLASWGMSIRKPSDLGYSDDSYILPPLHIEPIFVYTNYAPNNQLFFTGLKGIQDRIRVRKATMSQRVAQTAELVNNSSQQWLVWCGLNAEANEVAAMIPDAENIQGSDSIKRKIEVIEAFQDGNLRVLVTKPAIAGMGMNFQNCHNQAFLGLNDSWEQYYQAIRRSWRFGQQHPVNVYIVLADIEDAIYHNVMAKEKKAQIMREKLIENIQQYERAEIDGAFINGWKYQEDDTSGKGWHMMLGDSVERLNEIKDDSIDLSVFSPPFQSLYTYSPTERDLGNSRSAEQFNQHFGYIVDHLLRITKPGRICAVHVADIPAMLVRDGYIGMKDFSGDIIRLFIDHGWIFDARIPIDKNQQAQSIRTHSKGLTMTQMHKDRSWLRPALPDYILKFRKPGENAVPVVGGMTGDEWIELANPTWPNEQDRCAEWGAWTTWYGIKESNTLQGWQSARGKDDERHICPLQLNTIERCIRLWTNPGELVLDPFAGIGSTGDQALRLDRQFIGIELKPEYYQVAVNNLRKAEADMSTPDLFSWALMQDEQDHFATVV